jgi:hypothetical protein
MIKAPLVQPAPRRAIALWPRVFSSRPMFELRIVPVLSPPRPPRHRSFLSIRSGCLIHEPLQVRQASSDRTLLSTWTSALQCLQEPWESF